MLNSYNNRKQSKMTYRQKIQYYNNNQKIKFLNNLNRNNITMNNNKVIHNIINKRDQLSVKMSNVDMN